jgi:hypothetical protein
MPKRSSEEMTILFTHFFDLPDMKNILFALLVAVVMQVPLSASAQTDAENILSAKNATDVTHNCYDAMRFLDKVSAEGKKKEDYLLTEAKAHDCKTNKETAIYYYKKYLELQPANDSVKKRVAELSDQVAQQAKVAKQEVIINETYQYEKKHSSRRRKYDHSKKHLNIYDNYMTIGISGDVALGGANAPYKHGITADYTGGYPIIHKHVILGYSLTSGAQFGPNLPWFGNVFSMPASQVQGVGMGLVEGLSFIPMSVIVNNRRLSLSVGPKIGFNFYYTPEPSVSIGGAASFNDGSDVGLAYGLRANLFIGDFGLFGEYSTFSIKSATAELNGVTYSTPVNRSVLRFGVAYRFDSNHRFGWW